MSENLLIDANKLKNNNIQKQFIEDYLCNIIKEINSEIKLAKDRGEYSTVVDLPVIFDIPNMQNSIAQVHIWSKTIEILKKKNFRVLVDRSKNQVCRFKIIWLEKIEEEELKRKINLIDSCTATF